MKVYFSSLPDVFSIYNGVGDKRDPQRHANGIDLIPQWAESQKRRLSRVQIPLVVSLCLLDGRLQLKLINQTNSRIFVRTFLPSLT